jgi:hypothetical protein
MERPKILLWKVNNPLCLGFRDVGVLRGPCVCLCVTSQNSVIQIVLCGEIWGTELEKRATN